MPEMKPHVIVIAGPNGAGKSTTAPVLLKGTLGVTEFVICGIPWTQYLILCRLFR